MNRVDPPIRLAIVLEANWLGDVCAHDLDLGL
jgi:hypothetical protein